jgi:hypothetical protein
MKRQPASREYRHPTGIIIVRAVSAAVAVAFIAVTSHEEMRSFSEKTHSAFAFRDFNCLGDLPLKTIERKYQ